ncbi:hypothetical protein MBUL_04163 [Methylobacterium bullatum]|uniref:Outer membrane protein beta-barrel domain-containing protein n=1 Tax=Methylobacterium bullatum TaxID=570505 RepID=A0A679JN93_9HYPH|nr:hypothetical protein MBUL_04163 [Methylobacterium bullatum]
MRTVTLALLTSVALGHFSTTQAADLDYGVLRGPDYAPASAEIDWNGFYFGAHAGYSSTSQKYTNRFSNILNDYLSKRAEYFPFSTALTESVSGLSVFERRGDGTGFGGFAGYNYMFDETVIGVEADYTTLDAAARSRDFQNNNFYDINSRGALYRVNMQVKGLASAKIVDYGTLRVRAGYTLGDFMPFVSAGLAIGRAEIGQQIVVSATNSKFNRTISEGNIGGDPSNAVIGAYAKTKVVGGFAAGAGLEYALTQNILLRGEYQYVQFNDFDGYKINLNTVRGGAAMKF